jgi:hypothetical protein
VLIFLRNQAVLGRRRRALAAARFGPRFLREVVSAAAEAPRPVYLVPLAIVQGGTGYRRRESRVATLLYSVQDAPGEAKRLFSYVWNRGQAQLVSGQPVASAMMPAPRARRRTDSPRLARMLQIRLYREERIVQGPVCTRRAVRKSCSAIRARAPHAPDHERAGCRAVRSWGGALRKEMAARQPLLQHPRVRLQPRLATRVLGLEITGSARHRADEGASIVLVPATAATSTT